MELEMCDLILVISDKPDPERDAVAAAWVAAGGEVLRLGRFWEPPPLAAERVRVYGADTFCQVVAQKLALTLVGPADDLLLRLSPSVVKRTIRAATAGEIASIDFPVFVKSYIPKLIRSRVYASQSDLAGELHGVEPATELLVSEILELEAEARAWVLDGEVVSIACYDGDEELGPASALASAAAHEPVVPSPCVIDVGLTRDRGWIVIEANAAWGSGLNGCEARAAARCIARATRSLV
jgi:hypothetical protein